MCIPVSLFKYSQHLYIPEMNKFSLTKYFTTWCNHKIIAQMLYIFHAQKKITMEQIPSRETNRFTVGHNILAFYGNRRFITAFTSDRHLALSSTKSIHPCPASHFRKMHLNNNLTYTPISSSSSFRFPHRNPVCTSSLLPQFERPRFASIENNRQNYISLHIFGWQTQR